MSIKAAMKASLRSHSRSADASATGPPPADGKHLPDEAGGGIAAQIRGEERVLLRGHQPSEGHLPLEALLEARVGLHLRAVIGRVGHEVLRDGIHLDAVLNELQRDG